MEKSTYDEGFPMFVGVVVGFAVVALAFFLTLSYISEDFVMQSSPSLVSWVLLHVFSTSIQSGPLGMLTYFLTIMFLMMCVLFAMSIVVAFIRVFTGFGRTN